MQNQREQNCGHQEGRINYVGQVAQQPVIGGWNRGNPHETPEAEQTSGQGCACYVDQAYCGEVRCEHSVSRAGQEGHFPGFRPGCKLRNRLPAG